MLQPSQNELNCIVGTVGTASPEAARDLTAAGFIPEGGPEDFALWRRGTAQASRFALPGRDAEVIVLGTAAARGLGGRDLAEAIVECVEGNDPGLLRRVSGLFTVIVRDLRRKRVHFVSDVLGVHPFFIGERTGGLVFGTDAAALRKAGLSAGHVDYDAVSSWMIHGYNLTRGTLFDDLRRLAPGSVTAWEDGRLSERCYGPDLRCAAEYAPEEAAGAIHDMVSRNFDLMMDGAEGVNVLLSGGYDSRYLAGLLARRGGPDLRPGGTKLTNVAVTDAEGALARETALRLGMELETIRVPGSIWDTFSEPFNIRPDGFPITRNLLILAAERDPDLRIINGYLGDPLVRGSHDKLFGRYEWEFTEDLAAVLGRAYTMWRYDFFDRQVIGRIRERADAVMAREIAGVPVAGKVFTWIDLYCRQRLYISNNFLEHGHISQPILPFYSPELIYYKLRQPYWNFTQATYRQIFRDHLPELADLPHSADLAPNRGRANNRLAAKIHRRWAVELIAKLLADGSRLPFLDRTAVIPRLAAALADPRMDYLVVSLKHWLHLEDLLRVNGVELDWRRV